VSTTNKEKPNPNKQEKGAVKKKSVYTTQPCNAQRQMKLAFSQETEESEIW